MDKDFEICVGNNAYVSTVTQADAHREGVDIVELIKAELDEIRHFILNGGFTVTIRPV